MAWDFTGGFLGGNDKEEDEKRKNATWDFTGGFDPGVVSLPESQPEQTNTDLADFDAPAQQSEQQPSTEYPAWMGDQRPLIPSGELSAGEGQKTSTLKDKTLAFGKGVASSTFVLPFAEKVMDVSGLENKYGGNYEYNGNGELAPVQPPTTGERIAEGAGELVGSLIPIAGLYGTVGRGAASLLPEATTTAAKLAGRFVPGAVSGGIYGGVESAIEGEPLSEVAKGAATDALLFGGGDVAFGAAGKFLRNLKDPLSMPKIEALGKNKENISSNSLPLGVGAMRRTLNNQDTVNTFVDNALSPKDNIRRYLDLREVTSNEVKTVQGLINKDITGYVHQLDNYNLRHAIKHSDTAKETKRGNLPITADDLKVIPTIIDSPDLITTKIDKGRNSLRYQKRVNGVIYFVEVVDDKGKKLTAKTMWKKPSRTSHDSGTILPYTSETEPGLTSSNTTINPNQGDVNKLPPNAIGATGLKLPSTIETITTKTERGPLDIAGTIRRAYQRTIDSASRFNDVDKYVVKTTGKHLPEQDKLYINALNQRGADQTARYILEEGLVDQRGNAIASSFKDVVQQVPKGAWRQFEDYLKLKHFKAWEKEGMEVYDKSLNMNDIIADKKIAQYETQLPWIKQAADNYTNWIAEFGRTWLVDTGLVSKQLWQAMRQKYQNYIPFQRLMTEVEEGLGGAKGSFAGQPNPLKRARGSERKTIESIETMIERIPAYVKEAKRNEVMQKLIAHMQADPQGMEPWGKIVTENLTGKNVVAGRVNGERIHAQINDKELLDALTNLSPEGQNTVIEFVRQGTRVMKMLTTGINPVFSLGRNIFRDLPMSYVASKSTNNPLTWARDLVGALVDILGNRDIYKSYKAMGGGHSSSIAADRNLLAESKARIMPGYINPAKPLQAAGRLTGKVFSGLERLANVTETMPRLGEYRRMVRQGGKTYEGRVKGLAEANDVTVNFMRSGDIVRTLDAAVPYLNAAVQGLDKFGRTFVHGKSKDVAASWAKAIGFITVPTIALYAINHGDENYNRLASWVKDNNFLIPKGDGTFIRIPKPRESGVIFGALVERVLDQWKSSDPNAFEKFADTVKTNFAPPTRTIAAPFVDVVKNKTFSGSAIVPGYMQNLSLELQYDESTSSIAKALGDTLNISPKQVDYIVRSYTGVLGQLGIPALSEGATVKDTLIKQVTSDPVYSNDIVSKFYDKKKELDTKATDIKYTGLTGEPDEERLRKLYGKIGETISDTRDQMRAIEKNPALMPEAKKEQLRGMQEAIVTMADIVNKSTGEQLGYYNDLKRKGRIIEEKKASAAQLRKQQADEQKKYNEVRGILMK